MYSITLSNLAQILDAQLCGDGNILITGIASINNAKKGDITFLSDNRFRKKISSCQASAIILTKDNRELCNNNVLIVKNPYLAYAKTARLMDHTPKPNFNIDKHSIIAQDVILGKRLTIGANVIIESNVILGDDVIIGPGSIIGKNTKIGSGTHIYANVTIYNDIEIGECCLIQSGTIIGSDGFGYANNFGEWIKIPQLGKVIIGNKVEIGSCTTIDRGSLDDTYIGHGVMIDNQCQIAHNVIIGDNTAIAGGVIMAGGLIIGRNCMIGGASVINGHIKICDKVTVTGMGMVIKSITKPGVYSSGVPLQLNKVWRKTTVLLMHIINIVRRIKSIEKKISNN